MATLKTNAPASWTATEDTENTNFGLWNKFMAFADSQAHNHTLWFFITLMFHGVLVLALPAVLIYYFNASVLTLIVTLGCFFANFVANMCGSGIRVTLPFFFASVIINAIMILCVVL